MLIRLLCPLVILHYTSAFPFLGSFLPVCYEHVGCFDVMPPFNNAKYVYPQPPERIQTQFFLYTGTTDSPQTLDPYDASTITGSRFSNQRPTIFIVHGYSSSVHDSWFNTMTTAILEKIDANVITVDWSNGADNLIYPQSAANTRVVGATLANLIKGLQQHAGLSLGDVQMIGHSLGAHIAGYAGSAVPGCGRITGLDPAGPLFENKDPAVRLDPTDALFVEAIHTDGEPLTNYGFGMQQKVGHADFYPNGGVNQPGCSEHKDNVFTAIGTPNSLESFANGVACSHMRVLDLYIESIESTCVFNALPCESKEDFNSGRCDCKKNCQYTTMGYGSLPSDTGDFYLHTGSAKPFCLE